MTLRGLLATGALLTVATTGAAQELSVTGARWFTTPHVADYRLGFARYRLGPISVVTFGQAVFEGPRGAGHLLAGAGADGLVRIGREARPYLIGGVSGGFLDLRSGAAFALWHGGSAGAGFEVFRAGGLALGVEARYQWVSRERTSGISAGLRLGRPIGAPPRRQGPRNPAAAAPTGERAAPGAADRVPGPPAATANRGSRAEVTTALKAALDAMGTPYRWGGTTQNGFDCSGLIQFAYASAGIGVPRRSVDQARAGRSVGTAIEDLVPGDILAFSGDRNGAVTHVALYLGNGRFIHSANDGVVVSSLSPDDISGRWWLDRWVDSRRLID